MEGLTVEYKAKYVEEIKKTVIAFANTNGGEIFIGVDDNGQPIGLDDIDGTLLQISNVIRDAIKPDVTLFTTCNIEEIDGIPIVVVEVQKGASCPYYLSKKGLRPEEVYVRQGAASVPATETAIRKMIKETDGENYEETRALNQSLTFAETEKIFQEAEIPLLEAQMKTLHLIRKDGMFSNLALLLSDQCVHTIKLAVFEGTNKNTFKDRYEFAGSLLKQMQDAYQLIDRYNRTSSTFEGLKRVDRREYPPEAIREALLNAIVHRDYAFSGSILISIFDNRLEFVTIGGLVDGISPNDIMLGISILRNENLAHIFYRLKLIEAFGTGIPKIMESYSEKAAQPKIEMTEHAFKVTLPNLNIQAQPIAEKPALSENEAAILQLFEIQEKITRKDVENALSCSQAFAIRLLKQLLGKNQLQKVGKGKQTRYVRKL